MDKKEELINHMLDSLGEKSPDELNKGCQNLREDGNPKFAVLADLLQGLITSEEADRRLTKINVRR